MDATQYGESDFITKEIVNASKTKKCLILGEAKVEQTDFGDKMELPVEIDGKKKRFRPNKDTVKNLIGAWTMETRAWLGKVVNLETKNVGGKEIVIGVAGK